MSVLLDTHVVHWSLPDDPTLSVELEERLDHDPDVYISAASVGDVAIKQAIGKLDGPLDLPERIRDAGFSPLPIEDPAA